MYKTIKEFKNIHNGLDIWIVCAGASMNHVNPDFFDNKIVMGLNQVYRNFRCDYVVMKDLKESSRFDESINELKTLDTKLIFSKYSHGCYRDGESLPEYNDNFYLFEHNDQCNHKKSDGSLDMDVIGTDKIVSIRSTITSAMNIAAYMGAANIIVCGADNGSLDGNSYYDGYVQNHWISSKNNNGWLGGIRDLNIQVRDRIKKVYGCNIYSLNPFWNFGLEGHEYKRF
jgi:hypothetical protein